MAAGMHHPGPRGGPREAGRFLDLQRVHVGAQTDGPLARARARDGADDAEPAHTLGDINPPLAELRRHQRRGPVLLHAELGMGVDVASDRGELVCPGGDGLENGIRHAEDLL